MFFKYSLKFYLFWFWVICRRIQKLFYFSTMKMIYGPEPQEPTDQEKIKAYNEKQKKYLLSHPRPSSNIENVFYNREKYSGLSWKEMDVLKGQWKQRVLIEPLPIHPSSIVLFYNPEKFAFSYYCDTVISSYELLNAVAMKYTTLFYCQDFFVDEAITDKSALLSVLKEEFLFDPNQKTTELKTEEKPNEALQMIQENNTLFKKLKVNVKASSNRTAREIKKEENQVVEKVQCKNRFIYLGRVRDFNPLKKQLTLKNTGKFNLFPEMTTEPTETDKSVFMGSSIGWKKFKLKHKTKQEKIKTVKQEEYEDGVLI